MARSIVILVVSGSTSTAGEGLASSGQRAGSFPAGSHGARLRPENLARLQTLVDLVHGPGGDDRASAPLPRLGPLFQLSGAGILGVFAGAILPVAAVQVDG